MSEKRSILNTKVNVWLLLTIVFLGYWLIVNGSEAVISISSRQWLIFVYLLTVSILTAQAAWFLYWILFTWNDPEQAEKNKSPKVFLEQKHSFTALLPARNEEKVIGDTIKAIAKIDYPEELKELLVLVRGDDQGTIEAASKTILELKKDNIKLIIINDEPINKPNQLNWGLRQARKDIVVIFDAEDQPHPDIYNMANTVFLKKKIDVLQSGVQLVNFQTKWFSAWNVLEYYFWFKSAMHYFAKCGVVPLGGNTVFFKRNWLNIAGGWDENCLTEDAEIGIRLSLLGAKIAIVYDENHATQEETPVSTEAFIKQRTRWNQGYMQILMKGDWLKLPSLRQKLLAGYLLILPESLTTMSVLSFLMTLAVSSIEMGMEIAMFSFLPMGILIVQIAVYMAALWQFSRDYKKKFRLWMWPKLVFTFIPYLGVLILGSVRAVWRFMNKNLAWEKTLHVNAHRAEELRYQDKDYATA